MGILALVKSTVIKSSKKQEETVRKFVDKYPVLLGGNKGKECLQVFN